MADNSGNMFGIPTKIMIGGKTYNSNDLQNVKTMADDKRFSQTEIISSSGGATSPAAVSDTYKARARGTRVVKRSGTGTISRQEPESGIKSSSSNNYRLHQGYDVSTQSDSNSRLHTKSSKPSMGAESTSSADAYKRHKAIKSNHVSPSTLRPDINNYRELQIGYNVTSGVDPYGHLSTENKVATGSPSSMEAKASWASKSQELNAISSNPRAGVLNVTSRINTEQQQGTLALAQKKKLKLGSSPAVQLRNGVTVGARGIVSRIGSFSGKCDDFSSQSVSGVVNAGMMAYSALSLAKDSSELAVRTALNTPKAIKTTRRLIKNSANFIHNLASFKVNGKSVLHGSRQLLAKGGKLAVTKGIPGVYNAAGNISLSVGGTLSQSEDQAMQGLGGAINVGTQGVRTAVAVSKLTAGMVKTAVNTPHAVKTAISTAGTAVKTAVNTAKAVKTAAVATAKTAAIVRKIVAEVASIPIKVFMIFSAKVVIPIALIVVIITAIFATIPTMFHGILVKAALDEGLFKLLDVDGKLIERTVRDFLSSEDSGLPELHEAYANGLNYDLEAYSKSGNFHIVRLKGGVPSLGNLVNAIEPLYYTLLMVGYDFKIKDDEAKKLVKEIFNHLMHREDVECNEWCGGETCGSGGHGGHASPGGGMSIPYGSVTSISSGLKIDGLASHYCACNICNGKNAGKTASGTSIKNGVAPDIPIVACNWLDLGTLIYVDGVEHIVADRGSELPKYFGRIGSIYDADTSGLNIGRIDIFTWEETPTKTAHQLAYARGMKAVEIVIGEHISEYTGSGNTSYADLGNTSYAGLGTSYLSSSCTDNDCDGYHTRAEQHEKPASCAECHEIHAGSDCPNSNDGDHGSDNICSVCCEKYCPRHPFTVYNGHNSTCSEDCTRSHTSTRWEECEVPCSYRCRGYSYCEGHDVMTVIITQRNLEKLYFLDPIEKLESQTFRTPGQSKQLRNLKNAHQFYLDYIKDELGMRGGGGLGGAGLSPDGNYHYPIDILAASHPGPVGGNTHGYNAIDIHAPPYTEVYAFRAGTVMYAGPLNGSLESMITILGDDGYLYSYLHLDNNLYVSEGEEVKHGDRIATLSVYGGGAGKNGSGAHLHFDIVIPGHGHPTKRPPMIRTDINTACLPCFVCPYEAFISQWGDTFPPQ